MIGTIYRLRNHAYPFLATGGETVVIHRAPFHRRAEWRPEYQAPKWHGTPPEYVVLGSRFCNGATVYRGWKEGQSEVMEDYGLEVAGQLVKQGRKLLFEKWFEFRPDINAIENMMRKGQDAFERLKDLLDGEVRFSTTQSVIMAQKEHDLATLRMFFH